MYADEFIISVFTGVCRQMDRFSVLVLAATQECSAPPLECADVMSPVTILQSPMRSFIGSYNAV